MKVINEKKLARQQLGISKWRNNKGKGTFEYATGVGKTYTAILICKELVKKVGTEHRQALVIVPTIILKQQWEEELQDNKIKNVRVFVINTIVLNETEFNTDLLILDEIHRYGSIEFVKLFDLIKYKWILGLTATLHRMDDKHEILETYAPIIDTITQEEAKREGYISEFIEYNLGIELSPLDRQVYDNLNKDFHKFFAIFGHDFDTAMGCMTKFGAERYCSNNGGDPKQIAFQANRFNRAMQERKEYLYKTYSKLETTLEIIRKLPLKTVTFSESTEFADKLTEALEEISVCYHSNLKTVIRNNKKFGKTKLKEEAIRKFTDNRYKQRVINTAKALDQGFNVEDVELGIITSGTSNPTQQTQRGGRIFRKYTYKDGTDKVAILINIYIKNSQDKKWLDSRQTNSKTKKPLNPDLVWVNSVNELLRHIYIHLNIGDYGQLELPESRAFSITG